KKYGFGGRGLGSGQGVPHRGSSRCPLEALRERQAERSRAIYLGDKYVRKEIPSGAGPAGSDPPLFRRRGGGVGQKSRLCKVRRDPGTGYEPGGRSPQG